MSNQMHFQADGSDYDDDAAPPFSSRYRDADLHTHAPINTLVYHLGRNAFLDSTTSTRLELTPANTEIWLSFTQKKAREALKKMRIRIPGGKMPRK
jgi:hypothetical protein